MSEFQKVIKYLAMGFAIFLTVVIITGIATAVVAIINVANVEVEEEKLVDYDKTFENVKSIKVKNDLGKLTIKSGDSDKVVIEGNNVNESFRVEKNASGVLKIEGKYKVWNFLNFGDSNRKKSSITIYLPKDFKGDQIIIDAGAGNVYIEDLKANKLEIDAGVGDINGKNIYADRVDLDGGVGEITFKNVELNDVDINAGLGDIEIEGLLTGNNEIDAGVGNIELDLLNSVDDFNLNVDKGIGDIYIDGDKYSNINWNNKTAMYKMEINGGIGNVRVNFAK